MATQVDNGVNVEALLEARKHLTEAPEGAKFQWRATCKWQNGTHSHSTVEGFFGLGEEHMHKTTFSFDADHPELFASEDNGATPAELALVALASCLTAGVAAVAQRREIQLRSVTATLEAGMDVQSIYRKIKNRFPMVAMFRQEGKFPELSSRGRPFES